MQTKMSKIAALFAILSVSLACGVEVNIDCSSHNYKYNTCSVPGAGTWGIISVVEKYSNSDCVLGNSFGFHDGQVWVNHGCRAKFHVRSCKKHRHIDCDSHGYAYKECSVRGASQVTYMELETQRSNTACAGVTKFGITGSSVYVNDGCRGRFTVCYN